MIIVAENAESRGRGSWGGGGTKLGEQLILVYFKMGQPHQEGVYGFGNC